MESGKHRYHESISQSTLAQNQVLHQKQFWEFQSIKLSISKIPTGKMKLSTAKTKRKILMQQRKKKKVNSFVVP